MKKNKTNSKSMLRHTQTVGGNERCGNRFYCFDHDYTGGLEDCKNQCEDCAFYD